MPVDKKVLARIANEIEGFSEKLDMIHDQITDMVSDDEDEMESLDEIGGNLQEGIDKCDDAVKALREFGK